jgi:DNA polymerase-3 subunit gamma/tau
MARKKSTGDEAGAAADAPAKPYVVLARKYRPQTFDDLIGQDAMVRTLRNAFAAKRIAQGYMLTGVRGVGKTTTARILARALNYETETVHGPSIDMPVLGRHCADIIESRHPDVVEMDAASNTGIDNVREIIESARYKPLTARTKVFIIDEVHMLSKGAFNALLKTLEEPPEHVKFIFATTEIRKVPVTVLSRCQRFDLRRVDVPLLVEHFGRIVANEGATAEDEALATIARAAEGSVRDGLSILDQAIAYSTGTVGAENVRAMLGLADRGRIFDLVELTVGGQAGKALEAFGALHRDGADPGQIMGDLAEAVHVTARVKAVGAGGASEGLSAEEKRRAVALAERLSVPLLSRAWQMLLKGIDEVNRAPNALAAAEMVLIRIAHTADLPSPDELMRMLVSGGGPVERRGAASEPGPRERHAPLNEAAPPAPRAHDRPAAAAGASYGDEPPPPSPDDYGVDPDTPDDGDLFEADDLGPPRAGVPMLAHPRSFADVVALAGRMRDARLKVHLEDQVSVVKFDPAGAIDIYLMPGAPPEIANDLREKLNKWTGRRWVVMLSRAKGEPPIGEVRRQREAAELEDLKRHPAVAAVLAEFPDAKIAGVRPLLTPPDEETGTG